MHGQSANCLWATYQADLARIDDKYDAIEADTWRDIDGLEKARAEARIKAHKRYEHACDEFRALVKDDEVVSPNDPL